MAGVMLCNNGGDNKSATVGEWVDLGLPSGMQWYSVNLGAPTPEGYGDHYAWGETTANKITYDWSTYIYCNGDYDQLTKYCTDSEYGNNGFTDNKTVLEAMDDAATQVLGNGARIPTREEWNELRNNTTAEWTTQNGVNGRRFTGPNGQSLFLPAAGGHWNDFWYDAGTYGRYWSASLFTDYPYGAWGFDFDAGGQGVNGSYRDGGRSVRAVRSAH